MFYPAKGYKCQSSVTHPVGIYHSVSVEESKW